VTAIDREQAIEAIDAELSAHWDDEYGVGLAFAKEAIGALPAIQPTHLAAIPAVVNE
jgi:hypothetical protein